MNRPLGWIFLFLSAALGLTAPALAVEVKAIRLAEHDAWTRVVVELDGTAQYRVTNLSSKNKVVTLEVNKVTGAPRMAEATGKERYAYSPTVNFDASRSWVGINLKTGGPVSIEESVLANPTRIVLDIQAGDGSTTAVKAPQPVLQSGPSVPFTGWHRNIIIDPGHGGHHKGGYGTVNGRTVHEKEITIAVANKIEQLMAGDNRFTVKLTRRDDVYVGLRERTKIASQLNGHLFVSLHTNAVVGAAARARAKGFEIWTWNRDGNRSAAAKAIEALENDEGVTNSNNMLLTTMMTDALESQALTSRRLSAAVHGAFMTNPYFKAGDRGIDSARFVVLEVYDMPSILIEMGFLSHPEESRKLADSGFQQQIAQLIYSGIVRYYEQTDPSFPRSRSAVSVAQTTR